MEAFFEKVRAQAMSGKGIGAADALAVLSLPDEALWRLLDVTDAVRRRFHGDAVRLCSILNAKSGSCPEDCSFCSQSSRSSAEIPTYPLLSGEDIFRAAVEAKGWGARSFSIVTSGLTLRSREELVRVGDAVERIGKELGLETCASLGTLSAADAQYLVSRGLRRVHHNLETSRSFFPNVCTTHDYDDDVATIRIAKAAGARVCCGGVFGLGESPEDRVELALTLRELDVDSIPANFLNPIPGTPVEGRRELTPIGCLRILAMLRLTNPAKELLVCGGREVNLRSLQPLMFAAGASGAMAGNYLTTAGRPAEEDLRMVEDLGLKPQNRDVDEF